MRRPVRKLPNEVHTLILQKLDVSSLVKCTKVSRKFWQLARTLLFEAVIIEHRPGSRVVSQRLGLLSKLLQAEKYSVLNLIREFEVEFILGDATQKKGSKFPPQTAPITSILNLLPKASKLHHIHVGFDVSLSWERFSKTLQDNLQTVFHGQNMESISLQRLVDLPANVFQNRRLRSIELEACSVERSWKSKKLALEVLDLTDLHCDHNFPVLDIYSQPAKSGRNDQPTGLPYTKLKTYSSTAESRKSLRKEVDILKRSARNLEEICITFNDCISSDNAKEATVSFDLGLCPHLMYFKLDCKKPFETTEDLSALMKMFLQVSRPVKSPSRIMFNLIIEDESELLEGSGDVDKCWHALDNALVHENLSGAEIHFSVVYRVYEGYRYVPEEDEIQDWADDRIAYLLRKTSAKKRNQVCVKVERE